MYHPDERRAVRGEDSTPNLHRQIDELKLANLKLEDENEELRDALSYSEGEVLNAERKIYDLESEIWSLEDEIERLEAKIEELEMEAE